LISEKPLPEGSGFFCGQAGRIQSGS